MQTIPLQATPSQRVAVTLNKQACTILVYQKSSGMFLDLEVDGKPLLTGVICQNRNRLVRARYLGFLGDLAFVDTQGTTDPVYTGLGVGGRYALVYYEPIDLPATG